MTHVLALDLGGTKTTAALVRLGGVGGVSGEDDARAEVLDGVSAPTPAMQGAAAIVANAVAVMAAVAARGGAAGLDAPVAVGLASAGVIDPVDGRVTHATDSLRGWAGTDLVGPFRQHFGLPVAALNDVHAHGLGEAVFGAGRGHASVLLVAVGTGIGGCHVLEGAPVIGAHFAAGHLGHLASPEAGDLLCSCGRRGHLEGLASGPGIHAQFVARGGAAADTREVSSMAAGGDAVAAAVVREAGFATGRVIGGLLNTIDPDVVVLTGGVSEIGPLWSDAVADGVRHDAMDAVATTPVVPAAAGVEAALLGAAHWALVS
ncbi:ROK family protein [Propionibacteriaceae bacterium G57]|uniref:ROK family protein n=1 Tax=Aestuariimicrobium sp. G57 TaxID=3418485 RepID=UPI003DA78F84